MRVKSIKHVNCTWDQIPWFEMNNKLYSHVKFFVRQIKCSTIFIWVNLLRLILIWFLLLIFTAIRRIIWACNWFALNMAEDFENWIRPGYELVTVRLQWNVQVPTLQTEDKGQRGQLSSSLFSPQETPNTKWELRLYERGTCILIFVSQCDSEGEIKDYVDIAYRFKWKCRFSTKEERKFTIESLQRPHTIIREIISIYLKKT